MCKIRPKIVMFETMMLRWIETTQTGQNGPSLKTWSKFAFHVTQNVVKMGQNRVKSESIIIMDSSFGQTYYIIFV